METAVRIAEWYTCVGCVFASVTLVWEAIQHKRLLPAPDFALSVLFYPVLIAYVVVMWRSGELE